MSVQAGIGASSNYFSRLFALALGLLSVIGLLFYYRRKGWLGGTTERDAPR